MRVKQVSEDKAKHPRERGLLSALFVCILLAGCGGGGGDAAVAVTPAAPAPAAMPPLSALPIKLSAGLTLGNASWVDGSTATGGQGAAIGGVNCLVNENYHIHSHLSIFMNGTRLAIPKNVGLQGCAYELHTHDSSGIIHIETSTNHPFTLGQFFSVWGQPLSSTNVAGYTGLAVAVYVTDGTSLTRYTGNPGDLELKAHRDITIVLGSAIAEIPAYEWPGDY